MNNEKLEEFKNLFEFTSTFLKDREEIELSLIEEAGEILGILKKMKFHKHRNLEGLTEKLILEMGDFFWYYVANLKFNKKYSWELIERNLIKEWELYQVSEWIGTNKKIINFNRNIETISLGEYFAEITHFIRAETNEKGFELFYFFENVISKNIEKLKERYKPN